MYIEKQSKKPNELWKVKQEIGKWLTATVFVVNPEEPKFKSPVPTKIPGTATYSFDPSVVRGEDGNVLKFTG